MKCKICGQEAGWFYPILSFTGRCVHCNCTIQRRLNTEPLSNELLKHLRISEKACDKWLKKYHKDSFRD